MTAAPTFSVVIPTYNRLDRLRRLLGAIADLRWPADDFELVVVSDGSTDGTDDYLRSGRAPVPVHACFQANQGPAVARNHGVESARGEMILFLDDDVVPDPRLIEEHARSHVGDGGRSIVIGPMLTPADFVMTPWVRWEQAMLEKQYDDLREGRYVAGSRQFYTGNVSLARQQILDAGGFDPQFRRAEDIELAYRLEAAGARFVFNPDAVTHHYAERSFRTWIEIARAYGRANVVFGRADGQQWVLDDVGSEFYDLHIANQWAARLLVGRQRVAAGFCSVVARLVPLGDRIGADRLVRYMLSGIYNVEYCQGVADGLGGTAEFRALIKAGRHRR
jgi:glycosyltransferase involved in cell wall biosynthesis